MSDLGPRWLRGAVRRLVGRLVGLLLGVPGLALVLHVGDVARVLVGHGVGHNLDPPVGEGHPVAAAGGVTVPEIVESLSFFFRRKGSPEVVF